MLQSSLLNILAQASTTTCNCGPVCTCGLECLCRPRFFAGQLLTDGDLRRLDHYIVAKDRLHNRYLHGSGVVCGLEVVCQACNGDVTVRAGYALGPCGEDIIVCQDTSVSIQDLLAAYRQQQAVQANCLPYGATPPTDCSAAEQDWILSICYAESASRGVTSLRQPPASGGCGCANSGSSASPNGSCGSTTTKAATPPQCEPTLTCEGYTFKLVKSQPTTVIGRRTPLTELLSTSALARSVIQCLLNMLGQIGQFPQNPTPQQLTDLCCTLKSQIMNLLQTANVHDCTLGQQVGDVVCPDPNDPLFIDKIGQAFTALAQILVAIFKECVCSALLPPCATDSPGDCVPLATLTIRTADQKVVSICNWSSRKFAVTVPMLGYWLDWIPIFDSLRKAMVDLCCTDTTTSKFNVNQNLQVSAVAAAGAVAPQAKAAAAKAGTQTEASVGSFNQTAFTSLTSQYAENTSPLSGLEATVLAGLGLVDTQNQPLATETELLNPFTALALTHLAGPAAPSIVPEQLTAAVGQLFGSGNFNRNQETAANDDRVAKLEAAVADLTKTVQAQNKTISNLTKGRNNG